MTDSPYTTAFMVVWFSAAIIFFAWFFWRDRQDQKRREQRWQEKEERKREAQRQREQHLRERHEIILRNREQRYQLEDRALKLLDKLADEGRLSVNSNERHQLMKAICVEYDDLGMDVMHHENLYRGLSEEADEAINEIDNEEFARAERQNEKGMWSLEGSLDIATL